MKIVLAVPRGFCAGADRAIEVVERALGIFGPPIYVRHEIVHNRRVVDGLRAKGAVFVESVDEIPEGGVVVFSAHGVSLAVRDRAADRGLRAVDATCPLVTKVHREARRHVAEGLHVLLLGHKGHAEVEGTMGQVAFGSMTLVSGPEEAQAVRVPDPARVAYVTQTTLSVDEMRDTVGILRRRFPEIRGPLQDDICYATQNRQAAVKALVKRVQLLLVIGAPNSSNANRLREVAEACGVAARLIEGVAGIDDAWFEGVQSVGITAGASAPESIVQEVVEALGARYPGSDVETLEIVREDIEFPLPKEVSGEA